MQVKNTQLSVSNDFFDYLKQNLEKYYPKESMKREMISLLFVLAMKRRPNPKFLFQHWEIHNYSKEYSPTQAIALCEDFTHNGLGYDMNFSETISFLKITFPNKVEP